MSFIKKSYHYLPWLVISITLMLLWGYASKTNFVPCISNCGETFYAETEVSNFKLYGFKYGLLEDHATSSDLNAHPFLYTHNVNIAGILYPLLELTGIDMFWAKQLFVLCVFGSGLFYVYRTTYYFSKSYLTSFLMLLFFCTDYYHVFSYGLNALRVWHWLILFGLLFHAERSFTEPTRSPWIDRIMLALFSILSFGIGYDFWIISFSTVMTLFIFSLFNRDDNQNKLINLIFIGFIFAVSPIVRQIHVASTLGLDFWYHDFIYSAAIKVPFLKDFISLPPMDSIDAYYSANHILRAPATQETSWLNIFHTLKDMVKQVTIPSFGLVSFWNSILFLILPFVGSGWILISKYLQNILHHNYNVRSHTITRIQSIQNRLFEDTKGSLKLLAIITIGALIGITIFAPFSLHVYFKHQFPLLAAPILLAKSITLALFITIFFKLFVTRSSMRWGCLFVIIFIITDHIIIQIRNITYFQPISTAWLSAIKHYPNSSFATSWIPDTVAPYTTDWVVAVNSASEKKIIQRLKHNQQPFTYSDYFLFSQQDVNRKDYLHPDYWLYYTVEQSDQFDAPSPICYRDYLVKFIQDLKPAVPKLTYLNDLNNGKFTPGSNIVITGALSNMDKANIKKIELKSNGKLLKIMNYNCIYGSFYTVYHVPKQLSQEELNVDVVATYATHKKTILAELHYQQSPTAKIAMSQIDPTYLRENQLSVDELIERLPNLPISERGRDYVIFNLKKYYERNASSN